MDVKKLFCIDGMKKDSKYVLCENIWIYAGLENEREK